MDGADLPEPQAEDAVDDGQGQPEQQEQPVEEAPQAEVVATEAPAEPAEEYVPSFTYKVKDEEKAFDERLTAIIKTKEDEDYIRELYTKADGLDSYKEKYEANNGKLTEMESTLADFQEKHGVTQAFYQDIVAARDAGDHRKLMSSLGVGEDAILKYALDIAQERELPAEQRQVIEANRKLQEQQEIMNNQYTVTQQNLELQQQ